MVKKIQMRIDDLMTSMAQAKQNNKSVARIKTQIDEYKELLIYVGTNPSREFIESMVNKLKINIKRCEQKIEEETRWYTNGSIPDKRINEIKAEFDYAKSSRRLSYLNFILQD